MIERMPPRLLADHLLSHGRPVVTLDGVATITGLEPKAASAALSRVRRSGYMFSPHPGLYVAIPPQYRSWGVVPGVDFIDAMMAALNRRYYVALLSSAELYGAAHQRPQIFQVVIDRPLANRDIGRVRLRFYTHSRITQVPTVVRNSANGTVIVASPAATCLDLTSHPNEAGGLSNVATVVAELVAERGVTTDDLVAASAAYPRSSLRRLGWLLDRVDIDIDRDSLQAALGSTGQRATTLLDPAGPRRGHADATWGIVENTEVEPDL